MKDFGDPILPSIVHSHLYQMETLRNVHFSLSVKGNRKTENLSGIVVPVPSPPGLPISVSDISNPYASFSKIQFSCDSGLPLHAFPDLSGSISVTRIITLPAFNHALKLGIREKSEWMNLTSL
jgi:hypothetical protein